MNKKALESVLEAILSQPTAPFHEYHVRTAILAQLKGLKRVKTTSDPFGNVLARYKRGRSKARWIVGSHMDHPGWVRTKGGGFTFLGGVPEGHRTENAERVEWFDAFGMWELPAYERFNGSVRARACDDLVGCAILVAVLQELEKRDVPADFHVLFTRAEEVGFVGMKYFLESGMFPEGTSFISLETSAAAGDAEIGQGPVIRVGDRLSSFDPPTVATLEAVARDHKIPTQRQLLDKGTCEASAVLAHGIPAAGISVLLENYHNCGPGTEIAAESVAIDDVFHAAKLVAALAVDAPDPTDPATKLRKRMNELATKQAIHARESVKSWQDFGG